MKLIPNFQFSISKIRDIFSSQSRAWPILAVLAVIALIITFLAIQPFTPRVTSTIPQNNQSETDLDQTVTITFSRALTTTQQSQVILTSQPRLAGQLTFTPQANQAYYRTANPLQPDTTYTINLGGSSIKPHTFQFTTRSAIPTDNITATQLLPTQSPGKPSSAPQNDPKTNLINSLPHQTDQFHIQYTVVSDRFYISISDKPVDENKAAALDYIKTFGFDNPEQQLDIRYLIPKLIDPDAVIENPNTP